MTTLFRAACVFIVALLAILLITTRPPVSPAQPENRTLSSVAPLAISSIP